MTKEEREKAIDLLDNLIGMVEDNQDNDYDKALRMGIESLRKEPISDWHDVQSNEMTLEQSRQAVRDLMEKLAECLRKEPCEDVVSRKKVLNTLFYNSDNNCEVVLNKELQDRIKSLPPVKPTQNWIPCSERLPEDGQRVLVTQTFVERNVVYATRFPFDKTKGKYIIAWQPLPKPYKEMESEQLLSYADQDTMQPAT